MGFTGSYNRNCCRTNLELNKCNSTRVNLSKMQSTSTYLLPLALYRYRVEWSVSSSGHFCNSLVSHNINSRQSVHSSSGTGDSSGVWIIEIGQLIAELSGPKLQNSPTSGASSVETVPMSSIILSALYSTQHTLGLGEISSPCIIALARYQYGHLLMHQSS